MYFCNMGYCIFVILENLYKHLKNFPMYNSSPKQAITGLWE